MSLIRVPGASALSGPFACSGTYREPGCIADAAYSAVVKKIHADSRCNDGAPRICAEFADDYGIRRVRKRVVRLMRLAGIVGCHRRKRAWTTRRDDSASPAPDRASCRFAAAGPNELWVADITYVPTWAGFGYLATVLEVFSRRIVGWSDATDMRSELIVDAIDTDIETRRPHEASSATPTRDRQYSSIDFRHRCHRAGIVLPMGSRSDCFDNSMAESFFATLECELLDKTRFPNQTDARTQIMSYFDWHNRHRRPPLDNLVPIRYEQHHQPAAQAA